MDTKKQNYICLNCKKVYSFEPDNCDECDHSTFHNTEAAVSVETTSIRRPVYLVENSWSDTTIYDAEGKTLCRMRLDVELLEENESLQSQLEKEQRERAEFIVDAINSYLS